MTFGSEPQDLLALGVYNVSGLKIPAHAGLSDYAGEIAELAQLGPVAVRKTSGDRVQHRVESRFHHLPG